MEDSSHDTANGETKFMKRKFTYTWKIQKEFWPSKFTSPKFRIDENSWSLEFHPNSAENPGFTALYIKLVKPSLYAEVHGSVTCWIAGVTSPNANSACFTKFGTTGFDTFCERSHITNLNSFDIICEFDLVRPIYNEIEKLNEIKIPENKISRDFGNLLDTGKFSDVTLVVNDQEIKAHKAILSGRSEVFAAMFEHEMEETQLNRVKIDDIDYEVVKEMLHFIYTGQAPNLKKIPSSLLPAADKYALETLKVMCENELSLNVTVGTAAEILLLSDLYSAEQLKKYTLKYFKIHSKEIMKTEGWKKFTQSNLPLTVEVLCSILNS